MVSGGPQPGWQREPCPPWCVVVHEEADPPADRRHVSESIAVPLTALTGVATGSAADGDRVELREFVVCAQRRDGAPDTWIYAGDGTDQMIETDAAGWSRLIAVVGQVSAATAGRRG